MSTCVLCNHTDHRPDIVCCPKCGGPIQNLNLPAVRRDLNGQLTPTVHPIQNQSLASRRSGQNKDISPHTIHKERYLAEEELMRGDPGWELIGKHKAAYLTREIARESLEDLSRIQRETFARARQQGVNAELARRQAEFGDAILQGQLIRRVHMMANILDRVNQVFSAEAYDGVPDEIKADIVNSLYKQVEAMAFSTENPITESDTRLGRVNDDDAGIAAVDEF